MSVIFVWWLIMEVMGLAALPLAFRLFRWLPDRGYAFAKILGLLVTSYLFWMAAMTGVLRSDTGGALFVLLVLAGISAWLYLRGRDPDGQTVRQALPGFIRQHRGLVITVEALFTLTFLLWAALRAYAVGKIMPAGGEKFMEIAFLNGILNSPHFPPIDPWMSGFSISYYYFGYVMMALMTRLSGAVSTVAFDLYNALLFALTAIGAFGVAYNLVAGSQPRPARKAATASQPLTYGLLGALFVTVLGNLDGLVESLWAKGILPENTASWLGIPDFPSGAAVTGSFMPSNQPWWWWWRSSRVIQDMNLLHQPLGVSPITEFPMFSFLLGDNPPHVLALPFVLMAVGLGLNMMRYASQRLAGEQPSHSWWNPAAYSLGGDWLLFIMAALIFGALGFLNTWDFPVYLVLAVIAYTAALYGARGRADNRLWMRALSLAVGLLLLGVLLYIFFYLSFSSQASGILPYVLPPTRLTSYLIIFGPFVVLTGVFLVITLADGQRGQAALKRFLAAWGAVALLGICLYLVMILFISLVARSPWGQALLAQGWMQQFLGGLSVTQALQASIAARLQDPWLFLLLTALIGLAAANLIRQPQPAEPDGIDGPGAASLLAECPDTSATFAQAMIFLGLALTLSVEFIYLRDLFGVRMNTVFKFYYQAWVMLAVSSAFGVWWLLNPGRALIGQIGRWVFSGVTTLLVAAGLVFSVLAFTTRSDAFQSTPNLDGASEIAAANPDDWAVIEWLHANVNTDNSAPVILEAPGKSYTYEGRISAFTGLPAVLGWKDHETQWRGTYTEQARRLPDIETIFSTPDGNQALELLHKWNVKYVILGNSERSYISSLCLDPAHVCSPTRAMTKFDTVLKPVYVIGQTKIYAVP